MKNEAPPLVPSARPTCRSSMIYKMAGQGGAAARLLCYCIYAGLAVLIASPCSCRPRGSLAGRGEQARGGLTVSAASRLSPAVELAPLAISYSMRLDPMYPAGQLGVDWWVGLGEPNG